MVFVAGALPGDRVRARIPRSSAATARRRGSSALVRARPGRRRRARTSALRRLPLAGPRVRAPARAQGDPDRRRAARIGGLAELRDRPIVPAVSQYGYRNKLEYAWTTSADGPALGFHEAGRWDTVLDRSDCLLDGLDRRRVREAFVAWARDEGLEAYDQGPGGLPASPRGARGHAHRRGALHPRHGPGELPPTSSALESSLAEALPDGRRRAARGQRRHGRGRPRACEAARRRSGAAGSRRRSSALRLRVSAGSFLQTNTEMTDLLYREAVSQAALTGSEVVWDLYCGHRLDRPRAGGRRAPRDRRRDRRGGGRAGARERPR